MYAEFGWRHDAAWPLMWALGHIAEPLGRPIRRCDSERLMDTLFDIPDLDRHGLLPANRLLNEADLAHRYHRAASQAWQQGDAAPARLDPHVAIERDHAFRWLICGRAADWDEVTSAF